MARMTGVIRSFHAERGFGFVKPDDGQADLFVHISNMANFPSDGSPMGMRVEFELGCRRNGRPEAIKVTRLKTEAA